MAESFEGFTLFVIGWKPRLGAGVYGESGALGCEDGVVLIGGATLASSASLTSRENECSLAVVVEVVASSSTINEAKRFAVGLIGTTSGLIGSGIGFDGVMGGRFAVVPKRVVVVVCWVRGDRTTSNPSSSTSGEESSRRRRIALPVFLGERMREIFEFVYVEDL